MGARKAIVGSLLAIFLCVGCNACLADERDTQIQAAVRLSERAQHLYENDDFKAALPVAVNALSLNEKLCESGVGDVHGAEGVYGLRRAFALAGAQTQVTSLWKVADRETRKLMERYYGHLVKGEGRSAALREAQLDLLRSQGLSHPYYWASFVATGDWSPMQLLH